MIEDALATAAAMLDARSQHAPETVVAAMEAAARRVETPCGGGTMVWRTFGAGAPLVLLHGGHGSWLHWIAMIPSLARRRTLYVPDLPGFGESAAIEAPAAGEAAARAIAAPVLQGLDTLAPGEGLALAGFSFGGIVAATVAASVGRRATSLAIVGSLGLGQPISDRPSIRSVRNLSTPEALAAAHRANLGAMMIHDPAKVDALAVHIQTLNVPRARTASRSISRSLALGEALAGVRCPVTAIYGERDVVSPDHADRAAILSCLRPDIVQHVIAGVGHWTPYEAPDETARLMRGELP